MPRAARALLSRTHLTRKVIEEPSAKRAYGLLFIAQMEAATERASRLRAAAVLIEDPDFTTQSESEQ
jgi:hypothetical protein